MILFPPCEKLRGRRRSQIRDSRLIPAGLLRAGGFEYAREAHYNGSAKREKPREAGRNEGIRHCNSAWELKTCLVPQYKSTSRPRCLGDFESMGPPPTTFRERTRHVIWAVLRSQHTAVSVPVCPSGLRSQQDRWRNENGDSRSRAPFGSRHKTH